MDLRHLPQYCGNELHHRLRGVQPRIQAHLTVARAVLQGLAVASQTPPGQFSLKSDVPRDNALIGFFLPIRDQTRANIQRLATARRTLPNGKSIAPAPES